MLLPFGIYPRVPAAVPTAISPHHPTPMTHFPLRSFFRAGILNQPWSVVAVSVMDRLTGVIFERSSLPLRCVPVAATVDTGGQRFIQISDISNFLPAGVPESPASGLTIPLVRTTGWRWRH